MFKHVVEARKLLTYHKFDKVMYKQEKGVTPPTFAHLVTKYKLVELLEKIPLTLDQDLLDKIAALKEFIQATRDNYHNALLTTCEVLEQKYRESIQGTHKTLLFSLYDNRPEDVKYNTEHKCPYRWYQFKQMVQPCINKEKATATLAELNKVYQQNHPATLVGISDDCTQNAYLLLDYIKNVPLPAPKQTCSSIYDLLQVIKVFHKQFGLKSSAGYTTKDVANLADTRRQIITIFNTLCPEDAYILSTKVPLYVNEDTQGKMTPAVQGRNKSPINWDYYWEPLENPKKGISKNLKMAEFDAKVAQYGRQQRKRGGSRRRTRKLRS